MQNNAVAIIRASNRHNAISAPQIPIDNISQTNVAVENALAASKALYNDQIKFLRGLQKEVDDTCWMFEG